MDVSTTTGRRTARSSLNVPKTFARLRKQSDFTFLMKQKLHFLVLRAHVVMKSPQSTPMDPHATRREQASWLPSQPEARVKAQGSSSTIPCRLHVNEYVTGLRPSRISAVKKSSV